MWSARFQSHMNHVSVSPTDGNGPTQGQRKTLTRVGIEFPSVGLTLTWFIWDWNLALHITFYSDTKGTLIVFLQSLPMFTWGTASSSNAWFTLRHKHKYKHKHNHNDVHTCCITSAVSSRKKLAGEWDEQRFQNDARRRNSSPTTTHFAS